MCVDKANQLLTRYLAPLAPLSQVDEWNAELSRIMAAKILKNPNG